MWVHPLKNHTLIKNKLLEAISKVPKFSLTEHENNKIFRKKRLFRYFL